MLKRTILALAVAVGAWAPPLPAQTHVPETHRIDIQDFAFVPTRIEVHVGDIVEWTNRDFAPHTATADNGAWDTGAIKNEATGRFVATTPGTLAYHCAFHPRMQGVITVVAGTAVQSSRRELPEPAILSMIPWGGFGRVEACSQRRDVADWALSVSYPDVVSFRVHCGGGILWRRITPEPRGCTVKMVLLEIRGAVAGVLTSVFIVAYLKMLHLTEFLVKTLRNAWSIKGWVIKSQ